MLTDRLRKLIVVALLTIALGAGLVAVFEAAVEWSVTVAAEQAVADEGKPVELAPVPDPSFDCTRRLPIRAEGARAGDAGFGLSGPGGEPSAACEGGATPIDQAAAEIIPDYNAPDPAPPVTELAPVSAPPPAVAPAEPSAATTPAPPWPKFDKPRRRPAVAADPAIPTRDLVARALGGGA